MVVAMALLLDGLTQVPPVQLLPGYVAAYLLIGACIFGPVRKVSLRQAAAFLLPGALLVVLALLNMGFWAGCWLLGLPAWGLLLSRWTRENTLRVLKLLKFLGLLVLGLVIFALNGLYPIPSLGLFLLPVIPLIRLAYPEYRARPLQAAVEVLIGIATVPLAFAVPTPEGAWSSPWTVAGGAATVGLMIAFWASGLPRAPGHRVPRLAGRGRHCPRQHPLSSIGCGNRVAAARETGGNALSSFIVGTDHIDLLATAARRIRNGRMPDEFFAYEDTATAQSIGEALARFNNVAVSEHYQEDNAEPEYIFTPVNEILTGKLEPKHLVQIYLAAICYIYQTGEDHPDWAYSLPWATVKAIQFWAETNLYARGWPIVKLRNSDGYDWAGREDAAWEWTREHGFPDLPINPGRLNDDEVRQAITATERMGDQVSAALGMSRVGLLGRLVLAAHEDGAHVVLEPDGGRFVRCTVFSESGQKIAEINSPEPDTPDVEPTGGDEVRALLAMVDTSPANLAWTEFAPEVIPPLDQGYHAVDLRKASTWSPLTTRPRPSET